MASFSTLVIAAPDLKASAAFYTALTGSDPVIANDYYVGFQVGQIHIGLNPGASPAKGVHGTAMYWDADDAAAFQSELVKAGDSVISEPQDVGGNTIIATVADPAGNLVGIRQGQAS